MSSIASRRRFVPPSDSAVGFLALTEHEGWFLFKLLLSIGESKEKQVCGEDMEVMLAPIMTQLSACMYQAHTNNMDESTQRVVRSFLHQRANFSKIARETGVHRDRVSSILTHILWRLVEEEREGKADGSRAENNVSS